MKRYQTISAWLIVAAAGIAIGLGVQSGAKENLKTESRMPHLHHVALKDSAGNPIEMPKSTTQPAKANAYSTARSCAECHEYGTIGNGWHFNAGREGASGGRPGEPWILTDTATRTQIPLSYRGWKGTFVPTAKVNEKSPPNAIAMTPKDFLEKFAHHMPGGGVGEPAKEAERVEKPGMFQIDCLMCHDASGLYQHELRYRDALVLKKYDQAASVGGGFGTAGPLKSVIYDRRRFDSENKVIMPVTKSIPNDRCYYCHTANASLLGQEKWMSDRDVHVRAGMLCVDCHREGIDHMTVRGYENEASDRLVTQDMVDLRAFQLKRADLSLSDEAAKAQARSELASERIRISSLSCAGCHMGSDGKSGGAEALGGRLGAPKPLHVGLPPIHLEKLSCTACHSGPMPQAEPQQVQTAMAHMLGLPRQLRAENTPPVIVEPVFLRRPDGKITPHRMMWPSYWGRMDKEGTIRPIMPNDVATVISDKQLIPDQTAEQMQRDPYDTKPLTGEQIQKILAALGEDRTQAEPVFITAGRLYRIVGGKLSSGENKAAEPYAWPFGHDVRPAREALGARGCGECHSGDSPIYFGTVVARGAMAPDAGVKKAMLELRGDNKTLVWLFAASFALRPMLKYIAFSCAAIVSGVLLYYGLLGMGAITCRGRNNLEGKRQNVKGKTTA